MGSMTDRRFQVTLPEPIADAIHGEAVRCGERVGVVLSQFIAEGWSSWIVARLRRDLAAVYGTSSRNEADP
jgi:hypothetical protein